jgi:hypothetical protein
VPCQQRFCSGMKLGWWYSAELGVQVAYRDDAPWKTCCGLPDDQWKPNRHYHHIGQCRLCLLRISFLLGQQASRQGSPEGIHAQSWHIERSKLDCTRYQRCELNPNTVAGGDFQRTAAPPLQLAHPLGPGLLDP